MPARYILTATAHGLVIWRKDDKARLETRFEPGETEAFSRWLSMHSDAVFYLLADVTDERFQIETLPAVRGHERRALLARKLRKHFPDAPFSMASIIDGDNTRQRNITAIFSALTESRALNPWLDTLHAQAVPLAGIYTPPLLMHHLLDKAATKIPQLLLVTMSRSGLRQSLFKSGKLLFSRLMPLDSPEEGAAILRAETLRLHQYLLGQRLLDSARPLPVHCLIETTHIDMLRRAGRTDDLDAAHSPLTFRFDDLNVLARNIGLECASSLCLDQLLACLLMRHPPRRQFGNAKTLRPYRLRQWRRVLDACTAAMLLFTALAIPISMMSAHQSHARQTTAETAMAAAQHQRAELSATLPSTDVDIETLTQRIVQWQDITTRPSRFLTSLQQISRALPDGLTLQRLEWHANPDDGNVSMNLTLHELPPDNSYDDRAERFVAALRQSPASEVRIEMPATPLRDTTDRTHIFQVHVIDKPIL